MIFIEIGDNFLNCMAMKNSLHIFAQQLVKNKLSIYGEQSFTKLDQVSFVGVQLSIRSIFRRLFYKILLNTAVLPRN